MRRQSPRELHILAGVAGESIISSEMTKRIDSNMSLLNPEEFMKNWMTLGAGAQEQFRRFMDAATPKK